MSDLVDNDVIFEFSINIEAPCQDVFDLFADLSRAAEVAGAPKVKMITNPPITVGTKWIVKRLFGLLRSYSTIINYDSPRNLVRQLSGYGITGIIEDVFEPMGNITKVTRKVNLRNVRTRAGLVTRKVNLKGNMRIKVDLKSKYIDYFEKIRIYLERRIQLELDKAQLERDAQDQTIIAATRDRIKGRLVPKSELSQEPLNNRKYSKLSTTGRERENCFGCKEYEHARVVNSGPASSDILSFLFGPIDIYITCLYGQQGVLYKKGVADFCIRAPQILTGRFKRMQMILPLQEHEETYWNDAVSLFEKPELDDLSIHLWSKKKCFLIVTHVQPIEFKDDCFPLLSIDITDILPSELPLLIVSLGRLCSRNRLIPFGMAGGFGRPLFEQNLSLLPSSDQGPRRESALDILSLPVMVIPSMTIDFKYFDQEIRERFESVCEETLSSRQGALPFKEILEMRQESRQQFWDRHPTLPEEKLIREFWD